MPNRKAAFTLAELLVALTISSVIMLTSVSAFWMGLRVWHRNEDRRPTEELASRIVQLLRSDLTGVYLPSIPGGLEQAFMHHYRDDLAFYTSTPSYYRDLPAGRCVHVSYKFHDEDGTFTRTEQLVATDKTIAEPVREVIAQGMQSVDFHYETDDNNQGGGAQPGRLPKYVRVTMIWPTLSVQAQLPILAEDLLASQ